MIPELKTEDYDLDNNIPEELLPILLSVIPKFEQSRIDTLITGASKGYLKGTKTAYTRLDKKFVASEVKDDVYGFLKTYKKQINEGYTIIQGEKVFWLRDRTINERQKIFDIISQGVTEGKSPDRVKKAFQDYFSMQKREAEMLARTENAYVQCNGRDARYKKFGVEKIKWLLGNKPCPECQRYGGNIYTWDTLPKQQPAHVGCTCDLSPILD